MPVYFTSLFSVFVYGLVFWLIFKKSFLFHLRRWPQNPTLLMIWLLWITFLLLFAPLSYHGTDMDVWTGAIANLLRQQPLPDNYVYLPLYAQFLAAIVFPFHLIGLDSHLLLVYVVKWVVIFAYFYSAHLMAWMLPEQSELAPLGIVLAPVTVFYLFFGTNHIVMFFLLLLALVFLKRKQWFWAGFFAFFSGYKFLLVPTLIVLFFIILMQQTKKEAALFVLGGLVFALANGLYYLYDPGMLWRIIVNQGNIGGHAQHIEMFHFFYPITLVLSGFEKWYIGYRIWFYLSLLGVPLSLLAYRLKRLNSFQALAFSYAFVTIFAPEPYRLEPLVGLLWLDAVYRKDLLLQTAVFAVLFIHATAWYDMANSRFLIFDPQTPLFLWDGRGLYLGIAIMITFALLLVRKDKKELLFLNMNT